MINGAFLRMFQQKHEAAVLPKSQVKSGKMQNLRKVAQQAPPLLCLTSCHTHGTRIRKAARASPVKSICPGQSWPPLCT